MVTHFPDGEEDELSWGLEFWKLESCRYEDLLLHAAFPPACGHASMGSSVSLTVYLLYPLLCGRVVSFVQMSPFVISSAFF